MKKSYPWNFLFPLLGVLASGSPGWAQVWPASDLAFLNTLTRDVVESARVPAGTRVGTSPFNTQGFTLIKPGGGLQYPSMWVRDFAMSLESGFITVTEMQNHLTLIASRQNGATVRLLLNGLIVPPFAIPDHINFDGGAVFYPGTYSSSNDQGGGGYGILPPVDDHYEFVHIAWCLFKATAATGFLNNTVNGMTMLERLSAAFSVPKIDSLTGIVVTDAAQRAVGFGFIDAIYVTGKMLFPSLLRYRAAGQLAELYQALGQAGRADSFRTIQRLIAVNVVPTFSEPQRIKGWLKAATLVGKQPDVWGTLFALHLGLLSMDSTNGLSADTLIGTVMDAVRRRTMVYQGAVRHVPTDLNFSPTSAWEQTGVAFNTYQNGAFWHTPTAWMIEVVQKRDTVLASQLFAEFIAHLRTNDFRLGVTTRQAPWECFHSSGYTQNGRYMTSVTLPWAILSKPAVVAIHKAIKLDRNPSLFTTTYGQGTVTIRTIGKGFHDITVYGLNGNAVMHFRGAGERSYFWRPTVGGVYQVRNLGTHGSYDKAIVMMK